MSEEAKMKSVELSDEEMDHITGGKVAILSPSGPNNMFIRGCQNPDIGGIAFQKALETHVCNGKSVMCNECSNYLQNEYSRLTLNDVLKSLANQKYTVINNL